MYTLTDSLTHSQRMHSHKVYLNGRPKNVLSLQMQKKDLKVIQHCTRWILVLASVASCTPNDRCPLMNATKSDLHFGHWFQGIQGLGDNGIQCKGTISIVNSKLHFFSKPSDFFFLFFFLHIQRELHCNNLPIQQHSQK